MTSAVAKTGLFEHAELDERRRFTETVLAGVTGRVRTGGPHERIRKKRVVFVYHDLMGMHYQQEVDLLQLYSDVAVFNQQVNGPAHAHALVDAACRAALAAKGVAHINCPNDWQDLTDSKSSPMNVRGHTSKAWTPPIVVPQQESLESASALLNAGKKTVILSGLHLPTAITMGPDGALYVSDWGVGPPGFGKILRVTGL